MDDGPFIMIKIHHYIIEEEKIHLYILIIYI